MTVDQSTLERYGKLLNLYRSESPRPVRYRPTSWKGGSDSDFAWLEDSALTTSAQSPKHPNDRLISDAVLQKAVSTLDPGNAAVLRRAFVLVMAWGSGTSNPRSYRNARTALSDARLDGVLRDTAELSRSDDTAALGTAYRHFKVSGVGPSFFTKWFRFAGHVPSRAWQPLILDDRVFRSLNSLEVIGISTQALAGGTRLRSARYVAYVEHLHEVAEELSKQGEPITAGRLEWLLFLQNGTPLRQGRERR